MCKVLLPLLQSEWHARRQKAASSSSSPETEMVRRLSEQTGGGGGGGGKGRQEGEGKGRPSAFPKQPQVLRVERGEEEEGGRAWAWQWARLKARCQARQACLAMGTTRAGGRGRSPGGRQAAGKVACQGYRWGRAGVPPLHPSIHPLSTTPAFFLLLLLPFFSSSLPSFLFLETFSVYFSSSLSLYVMPSSVIFSSSRASPSFSRHVQNRDISLSIFSHEAGHCLKHYKDTYT